MLLFITNSPFRKNPLLCTLTYMTERNNSPFCESARPFSLHGVLFVIGNHFHTLANLTERESNSFSIAYKCSFWLHGILFVKRSSTSVLWLTQKDRNQTPFHWKTPFRGLDSPFREKESFSRKGLLFAIQTQRCVGRLYGPRPQFLRRLKNIWYLDKSEGIVNYFNQSFERNWTNLIWD